MVSNDILVDVKQQSLTHSLKWCFAKKAL